MLETERLILREYGMDDLDALHAILSDPETMRYYPAPFDRDKTRAWIAWNIDNYRRYGFGLWAVTLKDTGLLIGDCGITMQAINGQTLPEIGYHIARAHTRRGYAAEAARACRDYAFGALKLPAVYSYMTPDNLASRRVAEKAGMRLIEEYTRPDGGRRVVYALTRDAYRAGL